MLHVTDILDCYSVAQLLGTTPRKVSAMVQARSIPFIEIPGLQDVRFLRSDIEHWLRQHRQPTEAPEATASTAD